MATTTIPWGDGSGDNIYLEYSASQGDQTVLVSSDANGGAARQKVITFVSTVGNISRSLTVLQESGMDLVSITWNDVCITYNDTAIGYPYVEQYIVFVDSEVEQICATRWGDGAGIKPSQAAQVTNSQFGNTFQGNTEITSFNELSYFTGLTTFSNSAFRGCSNLEDIKIPDSVGNNATAISYLFNNCSSLKKIYGLEGLNLGNYCFTGASSIAELHVSSIEEFCKNTFTQTGSPFYGSSAASRGLYVDGELVKDIVIPNTVTNLSNYLFRGNNTIESVSVPNTITAIPTEIFQNCSSLATVVLPSSITSIANNAFASSGLTTITIPSSVNSIGNSAFQYCSSLISVEIGALCTYIGTGAFNYVATTTNKCTFILRPTTPPELGSTTSFMAARIKKIYVPYGCLSAYQTATIWSNYASYMAELDANGNIPT